MKLRLNIILITVTGRFVLYIEVNGLKVHYEIYGEGKEILVLHGWGANTSTCASITKQLSSHFKVIALDFPGFGESQEPQSVWGTAEYAGFVRQFLDMLNIFKPILIGHSFGGRVILYLTGKLNVQAHKIVLIDSAGIRPKRSLSYYYRVYSFKLMKNMVRLLFSKKTSEEIITRARSKHGSSDYKNASGIMRSVLVKTVNEDMRRYLPEINAPVLLVWGENDTDTPVSDGKLMEKLIPDAGLVVLKNAGHFSYLDKACDFNIIVDHFLREG